MPHSIPIESSASSAEIITLEQVIASARSRLDGLAEEDPAGRLLREQLAELVGRREILARAREDKIYASNKISMRILPLADLLGICLLIIAFTNLAARHIGTGLALLAAAVVWLIFMLPNTVWTRRDIREYRKTHAGER